MSKRTRIYKKQFWLNEEELRALKSKAEKAGMNESELVRKMLLDYQIKEKPDDRFYEVMKYMRAISNNINQIAKKANALDFIDEKYYKEEAMKWSDFIDRVKEEYLINYRGKEN